MSKRQVIMLLGVWIMLFLFLGFPSVWDKILAVITGFVIVAIAYCMAPRATSSFADVPFVEHKSSEPINNNSFQ